MEDKKIIVNLDNIRKTDVLMAGGKGANLGELIHSGFNVPTGFVITTSAYNEFVSHNRLDEVISKHIYHPEDEVKIRNAFKKAVMPETIKKEILKRYKNLDKLPVAVRSSATTEDLEEAAFAGLHETYLNVKSSRGLLNAILNVWGSIWSKPAISYRTRLGIEHTTAKTAVVVQVMINAKYSGVTFTKNPLNGEDEIVINSIPGLGEAIVSGSVTPDKHILKKQFLTWKITKQEKGKRESAITLKKDSGIKKTNKLKRLKVVPRIYAESLAATCSKIESYFKRPQDIEWALADDELFILQSRPITTNNLSRKQNSINKKLAGVIAEMIPSRPYPLESSILGPELLVNKFLKQLATTFGFKIPNFEDIFTKEDGLIIRYNGNLKLIPTVKLLFTPFKIAWLSIIYNPDYWRLNNLLVKADKNIKALESRKHSKLTNKKLIATIKDALNVMNVVFNIRIRYLPRVVLSIATLNFLLLAVNKRKYLASLIYLGINTKVTKTNDLINKFIEIINSNNDLIKLFNKNESKNIEAKLKKLKTGKKFLKDFYSFLDEYGYKESANTLSLYHPTWKESPELVFEILKSLLGKKKETKKVKTYKELRDEIVARSILKIWPLKPLFIKLLNNSRHFQEIREDTRYYIMMLVPTIRSCILELGRRLVKSKVINNKEDIFYLELKEIEEITKKTKISKSKKSDIKNTIVKRKARFSSLENVPIVNPNLYKVENLNQGKVIINGAPGSPGVATGLARVIKKTSEFSKLQAGEILIAPYTNPAWTPLFEKAVGVVVDTGSVISHAAIVAREYRIPAIMATVDGTKKIRNGDKIKIDGDSGSVSISK